MTFDLNGFTSWCDVTEVMAFAGDQRTAGGYKYSFIEPPDELVCLVCLHVAKDVHQVECCGKVFCKTCITTAKRRVNSCPNCRKASPKIFSDLRGARAIKRLRVSCENEEKGCSWSGELVDYDAHKVLCDFNEVNCPNLGCKERVVKVFLEEHLKSTCLRRMTACTVCQTLVPYEDLPATHPQVCPKAEIECTNSGCTVKVFRDQLLAHKSVCPKEEIPCPYSTSGCSVRVLREDKLRHLQEEIEHHCTIANNTVVSLRKELKDSDDARRIPPVTFKMTNYQQLKEEKGSWRSPYFLSHPGGYKMCLMVHPQSNCSENQNYLAVYIHIVSDRHDDQLVWPFHGEVKVALLNQRKNDRHHVKTVKWLETDECAKKPSAGGENEGLGFSQFISHSNLETMDSSSESDSEQSLYKPSRMFLKDDCLFFHVQKVFVASKCVPWLTPSN